MEKARLFSNLCTFFFVLDKACKVRYYGKNNFTKLTRKERILYFNAHSDIQYNFYYLLTAPHVTSLLLFGAQAIPVTRWPC